jgi:hypothetical protein
VQLINASLEQQHLAEKTWGDIPIWGVIIYPLIGYIGMIIRGETIEMIIEGALATIPSALHQSDILFQKRRDRGSSLRDSFARGSNPKEIYPFPLMSKGER